MVGLVVASVGGRIAVPGIGEPDVGEQSPSRSKGPLEAEGECQILPEVLVVAEVSFNTPTCLRVSNVQKCRRTDSETDWDVHSERKE